MSGFKYSTSEIDKRLQRAWNEIAPRSLKYLPWHVHATGEPWDTLRDIYVHDTVI